MIKDDILFMQKDNELVNIYTAGVLNNLSDFLLNKQRKQSYYLQK